MIRAAHTPCLPQRTDPVLLAHPPPRPPALRRVCWVRDRGAGGFGGTCRPGRAAASSRRRAMSGRARTRGKPLALAAIFQGDSESFHLVQVVAALFGIVPDEVGFAVFKGFR